ncbi:MAG: SMC-Scp complex subunit ScpB [Nitrososphaeria archaeon]|nr:SMC-Scp complex subunit ScpB [Aigarchaeota archaeon]MCX8187404.1 SMC-Scp complex subunit ScpB [Nitrososphaeria archaeon]MDW8021813.1 SMC-Scp complex subunit ScpB [Nitrososphaerota archaeon]
MIDSEELKSRIEAILYAAGKPVTLGMIMRICQTRSKKRVLEAISDLKKRYEGDLSALELLELPGERYYLKLKRKYMEIVKRILKKPLLSRGVMRTLSFIAYHQPVEQIKVAMARGGAAYKHVKILLEKGLIEAEKSGRTLILRTTPLFAELFDVENNPSAIKKKLEEHMEELGIDLKILKAERPQSSGR